MNTQVGRKSVRSANHLIWSKLNDWLCLLVLLEPQIPNCFYFCVREFDLVICETFFALLRFLPNIPNKCTNKQTLASRRYNTIASVVNKLI